jgi:hypothetical protein
VDPVGDHVDAQDLDQQNPELLVNGQNGDQVLLTQHDGVEAAEQIDQG